MALDIARHTTQVVSDMANDARAGRGDCAAATERCQTRRRELLASSMT
jgi:hypothetical protein